MNVQKERAQLEERISDIWLSKQAYGFPPKAKKKPTEEYGEETLSSGSLQ